MPDINKKLQKMASAIYLITSFFSDQEPLKWRLRAVSADLVSDIVKDKTRPAREALALFTLAKNVGLISDTNYEILSRELSKIEHEQEKPLDTVFYREPITSPSLPKLEYVRDNASTARLETRVSHKESGVVVAKKNNRQSVILDLIKRKKEIMIKDVSGVISDVSEKTIQRELLAMVASGVLNKIGEKRWSRYSLA